MEQNPVLLEPRKCPGEPHLHGGEVKARVPGQLRMTQVGEERTGTVAVLLSSRTSDEQRRFESSVEGFRVKGGGFSESNGACRSSALHAKLLTRVRGEGFTHPLLYFLPSSELCSLQRQTLSSGWCGRTQRLLGIASPV